MGHISKEAKNRAMKAGGRVTSLKVRAKPKKAPVPTPQIPALTPPVVDLQPLTSLLTQQAANAMKQGEMNTGAVEDLIAVLNKQLKNKPAQAMRLKCHRCMDRSAPNYLLMEYIDVIPISKKVKS